MNKSIKIVQDLYLEKYKTLLKEVLKDISKLKLQLGKKKEQHTNQKEAKWSLLADDMILHTENPKDSTKKNC